MAELTETTSTIWQALDSWAQGLVPWKKLAVLLAIEHGRLSDTQLDELYERFLEAEDLADAKPRADVPSSVTGRPVEALSAMLRLDHIDSLSNVNALPDGSYLPFGPQLTVIYGRNGAGKSGFGRLCANACFSRSKPEIVANIYGSDPAASPSAKFHFTIGDEAQPPFEFAEGKQHDELKRIGVFDADGALARVSAAAPVEFKPAGFDVFPELVRVFTNFGERLAAAVKERTHTTTFSDSFIGIDTEISKAVAALGPSSDLKTIRALATYGDSEKARLVELDAQLTALKSRSPADRIAQLEQAKGDIDTLISNLNRLSNAFSATEVNRRNGLSSAARQAAETASAMGTDTFKRSFFKAVGSPEWQTFAKSAHALARCEGQAYPVEGDRCLLCERPFDQESRTHVEALLSFVEGDVQRASEAAAGAVDRELQELATLDLSVFDNGSRVREHVHRIDPTVEDIAAASVEVLKTLQGDNVSALKSRSGVAGSADVALATARLTALSTQVEGDIKALKAEDSTKAIESLETGRQTLRHREVLSQLLPRIEVFVQDAGWCLKAERAKTALNPRAVTDKEKELFTKIIGESYRKRLLEECQALDCALPIELQTTGQKGQTIRSLTMKGGHRPNMILSEGEQRAIALADFLTEVGLNPISAGIVLDDPVTSQDHERKGLIAERLVLESKARQVVIFTHDLPFLSMLLTKGEEVGVNIQSHWIDRNGQGKPGEIALNDAPATTKFYLTTEKARQFLAEAKRTTGSVRENAIKGGMGALRRTIEETVAKHVLKEVVGRWSDRVMVTALRKVSWDPAHLDALVDAFEYLSRWIEAHSHTDEASGAPPETKDLEEMISKVDALIAQSKPDRPKAKPATVSVKEEARAS